MCALGSTSLDCNCKRWRLFADVLNDAAICLEISTPLVQAALVSADCTPATASPAACTSYFTTQTIGAAVLCVAEVQYTRMKLNSALFATDIHTYKFDTLFIF